jgi:anthranilate synthase component 2
MNQNLSPNTQIFMLDNLDSFTYNLVDEFQCLGLAPIIYRNTLDVDFIFEQIERCKDPVLLVLSPGPGAPDNAGCLMALIAKCAGNYPILGICLGHQALIQHYGGTIGRAPEIIHGKATAVEHSGKGVFKNTTNPLPVARYHSLIANYVPDCLSIIAQCTVQANDNTLLPMAIEHTTDKVLGFQFHPESILTTFGSRLLAQSIHYLTSADPKLDTQGKTDE